MNTPAAVKPPRIFPVVLGLIAAPLVIGGLQLVLLGGSFYYLVSRPRAAVLCAPAVALPALRGLALRHIPGRHRGLVAARIGNPPVGAGAADSAVCGNRVVVSDPWFAPGAARGRAAAAAAIALRQMVDSRQRCACRHRFLERLRLRSQRTRATQRRKTPSIPAPTGPPMAMTLAAAAIRHSTRSIPAMSPASKSPGPTALARAALSRRRRCRSANCSMSAPAAMW